MHWRAKETWKKDNACSRRFKEVQRGECLATKTTGRNWEK